MQHLLDQLDSVMTADLQGQVVQTLGTAAGVAGFPAPVGAVVSIERQSGAAVPAQVIGFQNEQTVVYPLADMTGVRHGSRVRLVQTRRRVPVGIGQLGRVLDSFGRPIDNRPPPPVSARVDLLGHVPQATQRPRIEQPLATGIRAIDGLLTCGRGQRMGIFAGSGVGKSVTLGMMARYTSAEVNVIALIGERGREVNEFLERDLGAAGLERSVVVVATSDQPALQRVQAALTATAIAEHLRDHEGKQVMLLMDSVTRFAMAQREIGLAAGEPPTSRGYPPSVFAMLPRLLERAGTSSQGSITAFYSVLVEGDDTNEPISDTVRGLLDGHTVLSRKLASQGHYPAIDVLQSISRLHPQVATAPHQQAARVVRQLLAEYREQEDLINIGAYRSGTNPRLDAAIALRDRLNEFLQQPVEQSSTVESASRALVDLATQYQTFVQHANVAAPTTSAATAPKAPSPA